MLLIIMILIISWLITSIIVNIIKIFNAIENIQLTKELNKNTKELTENYNYNVCEPIDNIKGGK